MTDDNLDDDLRERLDGYPDAFQEKVLSWRKKPDPMMSHELAEGILRFHIGENITDLLAEKGEKSLLVDDLGLDSLTMVEIAFEAEEFLGLKLSDDELRSIVTFGDLKSFIEKKAAVAKSGEGVSSHEQ